MSKNILELAADKGNRCKLIAYDGSRVYHSRRKMMLFDFLNGVPLAKKIVTQ